MSSSDKVIRSGPFKGKKITFASTDIVEEFKTIADDFMLDVFELEPGDYVISDESDMRDFVSFIAGAALTPTVPIICDAGGERTRFWVKPLAIRATVGLRSGVAGAAVNATNWRA